MHMLCVCFFFHFSAHVTVTDLKDFVHLMSTNIELNKDVIQGSAIARTLTW